MNNKEYVRHYFESQRPMTEEEEFEYWRLQMEQYWSKFVPMTPCIDMGKVLETMLKEN